MAIAAERKAFSMHHAYIFLAVDEFGEQQEMENSRYAKRPTWSGTSKGCERQLRRTMLPGCAARSRVAMPRARMG